jgi:hypothetical protein
MHSSGSLFLPIAALGLAATLSAAPPEPALARAHAALSQLPLRFEENQGQFAPEVRFAARGGRYNILFTQDGASLRFGGASSVALSLPGSNPQAAPRGLDRLRARTNYLLGARSNWHTEIGSYSRLEYPQVYPGIDLVYYGSDNNLEYDFTVAPGADPSRIRLRFTGAGRLRVTPEGALSYEDPDGLVLERRPIVYQDLPSGRREIPASYVLLSSDTAALRLGAYDHTRKLIVDPILSYSTYIGGTQDDQITSVQVSSKGLLYMVGSTETQDITAINGAYNNNNAGLTDIFLAIVDPTQAGNGALVYFSYFGGSSIDIPLALAVDPNGVAYMTGTTNSTDFPIFGNAIQTLGPATVTEAFIASIDPSKYGQVSLIYSTFLGGQTGANAGNAIALDKSGNVYVAGTTASSDFPVTDSAYAGVIYGPTDAFLTEVSIYSSTIIYSTYIGGESDDDARGIAIAPNGQVYVGISSDGSFFPLAGASYNPNNSGAYDAVLAVFDTTKTTTASLVYSTYLGGGGNDMIRALALDPSGNVLLTGYTLSNNFPVTSDAAQHSYGGLGDVFVAIVNPQTPGSFLKYATYLGGSDGDVAYGIASGPSGNIYVTGYTLSPNFPVTSNAPQPKWGQGIDVFVAEITPHTAGPNALQFSTYLGGATVNSALAIAVGPDGTAYVGGKTAGEFPTSANAAQGGFGGGSYDGFIAVIGTSAFPSSNVQPVSSVRRPERAPRPKR